MILTFKTKKSADVVFSYLTDMQKFVSVHPIIYRIDTLRDNTYLVYETLTFAFVLYSFTYTVTLDSDSKTKTVVMNATVMKINKIKMVFTIVSDADSSIINEEIIFKTPLPVKSLMGVIFKKQHEQLFENIEAV